MLDDFALRSRIVVRRNFIAVCVSFSLGISFTGATAFGQSASDRATARNLAAEGSSALDAGDFATAEDRFRRADALVHAPTLVIDHAKALMGLHKYVEAQERLELVLREGVPENAPRVWKKALKEVPQLIDEVKTKTAWVTISIPDVANSTVTVDSVPVPAAALGVRRIANPGTHKIEVTAPGFLKKELAVSLDEGAEKQVAITLERDPASARTMVTQQKPVEPVNMTKDDRPTYSSRRTLGYAALAVGGAGLTAGAITGILFLNKQSELQSKCPNGDCQGRVSQSFIDQRNTYGIISPVCFGLGLASGVAGVWLLLRHGTESNRTDRTSVTLVPYFALDRIGVEGTL